MSEMPTKQDRGLTSRIGPDHGRLAALDRLLRRHGRRGGVRLDRTAARRLHRRGAVPQDAEPSGRARPVRFVGQLLDGASKPVGGDTEATVELRAPQQAAKAQ